MPRLAARQTARTGPLVVAASTDTLRLERRRGVRTPASGDLVATFRTGDGRVGLTRVELVDASDGGLGVLSDVELEPGAIVTLRDGRTRQPWSDARAVRCTSAGGRYRVGLQLGRRMAA